MILLTFPQKVSNLGMFIVLLFHKISKSSKYLRYVRNSFAYIIHPFIKINALSAWLFHQDIGIQKL
jgi:hypothetical protein